MLSGGVSIMSSKGLSKKTAFQHCIPFIVTFSLGIELIALVALIILYDKSDRSDNLLYISTVCYLIISTIYFAWHSIIKENTFELIAFGLMSTVLTSIAVYLAIRHDVEDAIKYSCIGFFVFCQLMYYILSVYMYKHFHKYILGDSNESVFERKLVALRTFETFMSMIKVDFMLYLILVISFLYYVSLKWSSFEIPGLIIGIGSFIYLLSHSIIGMHAVFKERRKVIISYFLMMVGSLVVKIFLVAVLTLEPGDNIENLLVQQCYVVFIADTLVNGGILYLGYRTHKSFGIGAISIIRRTSDDAIRAPFI